MTSLTLSNRYALLAGVALVILLALTFLSLHQDILATRTSASEPSASGQQNSVPQYSSIEDDFSVSHDQDFMVAPHESKDAIVTLLFTEDYIVGVEVLAHSLRRVNTTADMVAAYIPEMISNKTLCRLRAHGWITRPVRRIPPVIIGRRGPIDMRFFWLYTKFQLWNWTDYDSIVYLDGDMLALDNFDDLFALPRSVRFAAVMDVWIERFSAEINAGMMFLRPDTAEYRVLLRKMETEKHRFDLDFAEQGLLSHHYRGMSYHLPFKYNLNQALTFHEDLFNRVFPEAAIVHYTNEKPFLRRVPIDKHYVPTFNKWYEVHDELLLNTSIAAEVAKCDGEDTSISDDFVYPDVETDDKRKARVLRQRISIVVIGLCLGALSVWALYRKSASKGQKKLESNV